MNAPAVTVIIPCYNRAHTLGKAIDSVLAQTFQDFEIVVVDDGSTDDTAAVLAGYGDRVRVIRQENRGVSSARNTGIRAAAAKVIAFLDSDDYWMPVKLARQLECRRANDGGTCFTRCVNEAGGLIADIDGLAVSRTGAFLKLENPLECIWKTQLHPFVQSMMVDKDLLLRGGGFDETLHAAEDTRLIYNLAFLGDFLYVDEPLVGIFRGSTNSLTYEMKPEPARKRYLAYLRVQSEAYWRLLDVSPEHARQLRYRMNYFISRRAELACAANEIVLAKNFAREGLGFASDAKSLLRCLILAVWPSLLRGRLRKKWYGKTGGEPDQPVAVNPLLVTKD